MNLSSKYGVYQGIPIEDVEAGYRLKRAFVTYTDLEKALEGLNDYAKAIPNELFLLVDEQNEFFVKGLKWDGEKYLYAPDADGMDAHFLFHQHDHEDNKAGAV